MLLRPPTRRKLIDRVYLQFRVVQDKDFPQIFGVFVH